MCEIENIPYTPPRENQSVGIDMGVVKFITLSNGEWVDNPRLFKKYSRKLRIEQRSLARKKKGSKEWEKQRIRLAKLYIKITRIREDFQHKLSKDLVDRFPSIYVEDLRVNNMTKSSKGTSENPGKNVKAKSGLNREILWTAPSSFLDKLEYKCNWYGRDFKRVNPAYTSQTCSGCGYKSKENRKSQSTFECGNCELEINADINAAINIRGLGEAEVRQRGALARA